MADLTPPEILPLIPNAGTYPAAGPPAAIPELLPTETMKQGVLEAVTTYMSKSRKKMKEEKKWIDQWTTLVTCATLSAHEGFLASAALNDFYVGQQIMPFVTLSNQQLLHPGAEDGGRTQVDGSIILAQHVKTEVGPSVTGTLDEEEPLLIPVPGALPFDKQCEDFYKIYDVGNDGTMSFGEFVTMQFVPQLLTVLQNQGGFPVPLSADGTPLKSDEELARSATELMSSSIEKEVETALKRYMDGLRSKVDTKRKIEIVGMNSIFKRIATGHFFFGNAPPGALQMQGQHDKAFSHAVLTAQENFMAVLLGLDRTSTVGSASTVCDLWMAEECKIFEKYDVDGNGSLDVSELSQAMERATSGTDAYREPVPASHSLDISADFSAYPGVQAAPMIDFEEMAEHFIEAFDADSNGTISRSEWLVARAAFQSLFLTSAFHAQAVLPRKPLQPLMDPLQHLPGAAVAYPQAPVGYASSIERQESTHSFLEDPRKLQKKDYLYTLKVFGAIGGAISCAGIGGVALYRAGSFTKGVFVGFVSWPAVFAAALCYSKMEQPRKKGKRKTRGVAGAADRESIRFENDTQTDIEMQLADDDGVFVLPAEKETSIVYNWNLAKTPRFNGKKVPVKLRAGGTYILSFRGGDPEKPTCKLSRG